MGARIFFDIFLPFVDLIEACDNYYLDSSNPDFFFCILISIELLSDLALGILPKDEDLRNFFVSCS